MAILLVKPPSGIAAGKRPPKGATGRGETERQRRHDPAVAAPQGAPLVVVRNNEPLSSPMAGRVQRFALQSVARSILPQSRTARCLRVRAHDQDVAVWKSLTHGTATYRGLQTCGSVWTCPVCAAKIAERRRGELVQAMELHKSQGGFVSLLTLTTPHQRGDDLAALLKQQGAALQAFLNKKE